MHSHVGAKTHEESGESRNGSGSGDKVSLDFTLAEQVGLVSDAEVRTIAHASATAISHNARVDGNDITTNEVRSCPQLNRLCCETHAMAKKVAMPARISVKK